MTTRTSWPAGPLDPSLWQPPDETLEAIAAAITSHWNSAAKAYRERLFWPDAASWLPVYHLTKGGKLIK